MTAIQPDPLDQIVIGLREARQLLAETQRIVDARNERAVRKIDEVTALAESLKEEAVERPR